MNRVLLISLCFANLLNASAIPKKSPVVAELIKLVPCTGNSYQSHESKHEHEAGCLGTASFKRIGDDIGIGYIDITIKFLNHTLTKLGRSVDEKGTRNWIENVDKKDHSKYPQDLALLDAIIADCRKRDARTFFCIPYQNEDDVERRYNIFKDGSLGLISEKLGQN